MLSDYWIGDTDGHHCCVPTPASVTNSEHKIDVVDTTANTTTSNTSESGRLANNNNNILVYALYI